MDLPVDVDVYCVKVRCGRSTNIVLNPVNDKVTHIVVRENAFPQIERLVPIELIVESSPTEIRLRCTQEELENMDAFVETDFLRSDEVDLDPSYEDMYGGGPHLIWPYVIPERQFIAVDHENIPLDEIAIRRGTEVYATDGRVGKVDEFLVDPANERVTHIILRRGHLWSQRDVTIPLSQIESIKEDAVHLKLDQRGVGSLPTIPVRRRWS
jgi:sporulation protein YlmC with PRC-barrel domain